jgi:hypothetical protein
MDVDDTSPSAPIHELARLGNAAGVRTLIEQGSTRQSFIICTKSYIQDPRIFPCVVTLG